MAKKKRQRRITVLCIPDDNAEPYSFRLSWTNAKIIMVVASVLFIHVIVGVVGYVRYFDIRTKNLELEKSNSRLLEDNKRVYDLASWFEELEQDQGKIMSLLGIENRNGDRPNTNFQLPVSSQQIIKSSADDLEEALSFAPAETVNETKGRNLIRNTKDSKKVPPHLPTLLPVEGFLSKSFSRSPWYPFSSHTGVDIAGKLGDLIVASGDGQIVYSGWHHEFGNLLIIYHGEDLFSYYGHNERLLVRERTFVKRGEPIAVRGNSGRSSGPHLHFEIWENGKAVDPRNYILALKEENP